MWKFTEEFIVELCVVKIGEKIFHLPKSKDCNRNENVQWNAEPLRWEQLSHPNKTKGKFKIHLNCKFLIYIGHAMSYLPHQGVFLFFDSSCSKRRVSCDMWDLVPWPGIEPRFPELEMWSLTTGLPGKPLNSKFLYKTLHNWQWASLVAIL